MNKSIDVIIPIYNTPASYLERCFLSALNQTYKNIKIIAIDDGSTSRETLAIIEKYKKRKNFSLFVQNNAGVSVARNTGLKHSKSDYVFFLDSDDYIEDYYLEHNLKVAIDQKTDLVFSGKINTATNKNDAPFKHHIIDIKKDSDIIAIKAHAFTCSAVLIDGRIARNNMFTTTTTTMGEDTEYIIKCMACGKSYFDGEGGNFYVQNPQSITHDTSLKSIQRYLDESILQKDIFQQYLNVTDKIINIYSYLKLARAYKKLSLNQEKPVAIAAAKGYIKNNNFPKVKVLDILNSPLLSKGEKVRIFLLKYGLFKTTYHLHRFISAIRNTK